MGAESGSRASASRNTASAASARLRRSRVAPSWKRSRTFLGSRSRAPRSTVSASGKRLARRLDLGRRLVEVLGEHEGVDVLAQQRGIGLARRLGAAERLGRGGIALELLVREAQVYEQHAVGGRGLAGGLTFSRTRE